MKKELKQIIPYLKPGTYSVKVKNRKGFKKMEFDGIMFKNKYCVWFPIEYVKDINFELN